MNLKQFYDVVGGDYNDATGRIPREASIIKFLRKFSETEDFKKMMSAIDNNDYQEIFATSHNMKGMCANLGLKKLAKSSSDLCEATRHGQPEGDISDMVETVKKDYEITIDAISKIEE